MIPARSMRRSRGVLLGLGLLLAAGLVLWLRPNRQLRRVDAPAYLNFPHATPVGRWRTVEAFKNLRFHFAVRAVYEPRTRRYYVAEREGRIWSFADDPLTRDKTLVLDLSAETQGYFDCGLLGLAFHPDFGVPGKAGSRDFFVWYNHSPRPKTPEETKPERGTHRSQRVSRFHIPSGNRLARFRLRPGALTADPRSETVLIDQANETVFHEGGDMFFHPKDGFLYLTLGDDDLTDKTQAIDQGLFSGVLRLDVDCRGRSHPIRRPAKDAVTAHYCIPDDNPFVDAKGGRLEEFWALGLRSPHTMSLDPATGRIWLGDVGNASREEIDVVERGANFEWPYREGSLETAAAPPVAIGARQAPFYEYGHGLHACVIAGFVYHGRELPELEGRLLFGDNVSNHIFAIDAARPGATAVELARLPGETGYGAGLSSFAQGAHGEILLVRVGDQRLFQLVPSTDPPAVMPALLSQTGAFGDVKRLAPQPGLAAYDVNLPHWTNGTRSRHWLALPRGAAFHYGKNHAWELPRGAVLVQHLETAERPLETRFLVAESGGEAYAASYRWREDGSDADLVAGAAADTCMTCHTRAAGFSLGLNARQLNHAGQLRAWSEAGLFDRKLEPEVLKDAPRLRALDDRSATALERVRSYLDVNCAHCHRSGGVRGLFDARFTTGFAEQDIVDGDLHDSLGMEGARVVAPGDVSRSILFLRLSASGAIGMPPVDKETVDADAVALFSDWIEHLPRTPEAPASR
jgi:hypothetical protein